MGRMSRIQASGAIYHVTSRAARGLMLYRDDTDRAVFRDILAIAVSRAEWILHAFCFLGTHYHLIVETPEPNIGAGMKRLNWLYSRTFNECHSTRGHLFESRYSDELIQSERHFLRAFRYVALNPQEAGLCDSPLEWEWSSYAATVGLARQPGFLTTHGVLRALDDRPEVARRLLRRMVEGVELALTPVD